MMPAMGKLFEDTDLHNDGGLLSGGGMLPGIAPAPAPVAAGEGTRLVGVVVNANLWRTFDYLWPESLGVPAVGQRVHVPFGRGNKNTLAFITDLNRPRSLHELKCVAALVDQESAFDDTLWRLGQWISQYYLTPLGMTLAAMVPSAIGRHAMREEAVAFLAREPNQWKEVKGPRMRRVLDELFEARKQGVEPLTLELLLHHAECGRETIARLASRGLIRQEMRPVRLPEISDASESAPFSLNDEQKQVLSVLDKKLAGGFSVSLLHGVTGSGKTEVYVQAVRKVIDAGKQAIVLVPEIALATQTLQRLVKRLPRVAVLHSGLTNVQRAFYWQQIQDGHASVVVGPRSAIFAPARKCGLIIVDEEHEPTYKQDTAPRYHGRDTAVMRASLAGIPVLLGSATPSMESYHNAQQGRYELLHLHKRVRNLPMPTLKIVSLRQEMTPGKIELLGRTLTQRIAAALDRREQIILLMNRRGYASYVFCPRPKCGWIMGCDHCTRSMVFHQATRLAMCHYCQHTAVLPEYCPACKGKITLFGMGIQRIESELTRKFPEARVARMDSDTMTSPKQFQQVFDQFSARELDILLGTQMVAKGLDFPRVSLVGVVSADTSLAISDFRASERTFQLIVQVAGRAGRSDLPGEVIVQTLHEEEPAIQFAVKHDYVGFAADELPSRQATNLPPFSRVIRFLVRHSDMSKAEQGARELADLLRKILPPDAATMIEPQQAMVAKIQNLYRFQILLICRRAGVVQQALFGRMEQITRDIPAEVIADVDPVQIM